jgi:hypothetical protein
MLYTRTTFSLPACDSNLSELQYDFQVGRITEAEFKAGKTRRELDREAKEVEVAAVAPAVRTAVRKTPRSR